MPDWGLANGPNDNRSHAEMMMQSQIRKDNNPRKPCNQCGGDFRRISEDDERPPVAIQRYDCEGCNNFTYDWKEGYEPESEEYKW